MTAYRAKKRLGQSFLTSAAVISKIVDLVDPKTDQKLVEIGPGRGALTLELAQRVDRLLAVEFDRDLVGYLGKLVREYDSVEIVNADFLTLIPDEYNLTEFSLIGNIPYNITTPVIDWCVKYRTRLNHVILMIQKELADRIGGKPGSKNWAPLSIFTQLYFDVARRFEVPPSAFHPRPKVYSAVIELSPRRETVAVDHARLERLVRASFRHRRKLLLNNLVPEPIPDPAISKEILGILGLPEKCRAEELTIEQFLELTNELSARNIL
ncbi:MAG: ribosomal RNA small subunit methyltransferase A [Candidatus Zixiibacteriota bacterium]|nr:MAG: ribosomal RNA small subunit methyltransferase A [candidate division Zixibacteria bacterium]